MFKKIVLALLLVSTACSAFVFARTPVVNKRERNQARRINQGVKKGELTPEQAAGLKQEVRDVNKEKREMRKENKGKPLTKEQREKLNQDLNKSSKDIYQEKHPGNTAGPQQTGSQQQESQDAGSHY